METRTVTLPQAVVEALYRQAKDELEMFARVEITLDQVKGNARMFYLYGEHLPAIVAACAPRPDPGPAPYFVPPCTCRIACSVGDVNYLSGIDDCPVHGFGPDDENATTNEKEKGDERATD